MNTSAVSTEERQINLILALRHTRAGMSKHDILTSVAGYGDESSNAERMFERDKALLQSLGIPISTRSASGMSSSPDTVYFIDNDDYQLPALHLSATQQSFLDALARIVQTGTFSGEAHRAITKLRALSQRHKSQPFLGIHGISEPLPQEIIEAGTDGRFLQFTYAPPGREASQRRVAPINVTLRHGAWYLQAFDLGRNAPRTFKLNRVTSPLTVTGKPSEVIDKGFPSWDPTSTHNLDELPLVLAARVDTCGQLRALATHTVSHRSCQEHVDSLLSDDKSEKTNCSHHGVSTQRCYAPLSQSTAGEWSAADLQQIHLSLDSQWDLLLVPAATTYTPELVSDLTQYGDDLLVISPRSVRDGVTEALTHLVKEEC
ncbi:helix-turn-helix transcriptional regulator [Actinomyces vulturis]|uniref:helix-turn-helix transcriptional regulator n=1 Tax=Actinomyces vulturis TaxID=1857645 RepID=UPI00082DBD83|nr:WYL domain-containing protein [Actinomyces vulturis]